MKQRYLTYNRWLRERFGERVHKVVVDAGFTCPNRDGTLASGGCTYCNNNSFRPPLTIRTAPIAEQVRTGIAYLSDRIEAEKFIVYFQPFSNTYANIDHLRALYTEALAQPQVVGLAVGTRPDCVDPQTIDLLDQLGQESFVTLELGVESIYDRTLERVNRAHKYQAFLDAMALSEGRSFYTSAHLILGFPWETRAEWLSMADEMSRVGVHMIKLHHLHVVRGTALAREYAEEPFDLMDFEDYADLVCDFVERLDPAIVIERLFGEPPLKSLIAPDWGRTRNEVLAGIRQRMEVRDVVQGAQWQRRDILAGIRD